MDIDWLQAEGQGDVDISGGGKRGSTSSSSSSGGGDVDVRESSTLVGDALNAQVTMIYTCIFKSLW